MDIEITPAQFADMVEAQHNELIEAISGDSPEAKMLKSFFSDEFLAEKTREVQDYTEALRKLKD